MPKRAGLGRGQPGPVASRVRAGTAVPRTQWVPRPARPPVPRASVRRVEGTPLAPGFAGAIASGLPSRAVQWVRYFGVIASSSSSSDSAAKEGTFVFGTAASASVD